MEVCIVCKRDLRKFQGAKCFVCGYPNIDIFGDVKDYMRDHFEEIDQYRKNFMQSISIGVRFHCWEQNEGTLTQAPDMEESFGNLYQLYNRVSWLPVSFTGRSKRNELDVTLIIERKTGKTEQKITIPNPGESECDLLGIEVDDSYTFHILIRNQEGKTTRSAALKLFD